MKVWVATLPGCLRSSDAITHDILAAANRVALEFGRSTPFELVETRLDAGLVIVPGLGSFTEADLRVDLSTPLAKALTRDLAASFAGGATLAASCASSFLLAEAGVLDGRQATTSWWLAPTFARWYPHVHLMADRVVVADGQLITGGAAMAQMDVMLALVARFAGTEIADTCARYLLLDKRSSQSPYLAIAALALRDERLALAERWVRDHLADPISVKAVAAAAGLSPRTFGRRLMSLCGLAPSRFIQRVRLETARDLLATTKLSVEAVSQLVGYSDASTLRRVFVRETGAAPHSVRSAGQTPRRHLSGRRGHVYS